MAKRPHRRAPVVSTVYLLLRHHGQQTETIGSFSSDDKAKQQAERLIKRAVGLSALSRLRLTWEPRGGMEFLNYGRDAHDFRFRVEPWPVDGEA